MTDLLIIGGGAIGVSTAVMIKQKNPNIKIKILEKNERILKKVSVTGNGRCNISNRVLQPNNYHGSGKDLAIELLNEFDLKKQENFFLSIGLPIIYEGNKGFPMSKQANSVVDCLRFYLENTDVEIIYNCEVNDIKKENGVFSVFANGEKYASKCVLVSCGSNAGGGKLASESGYTLLKKLSHKIIERRPSIVQVKTEKSAVSSLKGIKVDAKCTAFVNGEAKKDETGEVLFCDYGLSGPAILQLSRIVSMNKGTAISLDLFPETAEDDLYIFLKERAEILKNRNCCEFFTGMLNKRLGQTILKRLFIDINKSVAHLTESEILKIAKTLKSLMFITEGTLGMSNAQVSTGGALVSEFNKNLMSKKVDGLFAGGEVLDIDGDCGGYNLMYCWACANKISDAVIEYTEK